VQGHGIQKQDASMPRGDWGGWEGLYGVSKQVTRRASIGAPQMSLGERSKVITRGRLGYAMLEKRVHILASGANSERDLSCSNLASHRLRLAVAARGLVELPNHHVSVGDNTVGTPDILLVGKIGAQQIESRAPLWLKAMQDVWNAGGRVILDYTDNHLGHQSRMTAFYSRAISVARQIVVPSEGMKAALPGSLQNQVTVIPDALEYEPVPPRQTSTKNGVWYGHGSNIPYLLDYFQKHAVAQYFDSLTICTDETTLAVISKSQALQRMPPVRGIVWSVENQRKALLAADFAFLPVGLHDPRKAGAGSNRLLTGLCLGLPVLTQRLNSYASFDGLFIDLDRSDWSNFIPDLSSIRKIVVRVQNERIPEYMPKALKARWLTL